MLNDVFVCVMAGGSGERFWPLSRRAKPKHLLKLFSDRTLLEETVRRIEGVVPLENVFVLTNQTQLEGARAALPFLQPAQVIAEPAKRDTAPAAALATAIARSRNPAAVLALLPADALIKDVELFRRQFMLGVEQAQRESAIVTFAMEPHYPATGFGYLELGEKLSAEVYRVVRFVEKPNSDKAEAYCEKGCYGWNSGIFIWKTDTFLAEARRLQPALADFIEGFPSGQSPDKYLAEKFGTLPKISIDYAIMEYAKSVLAVKGMFDWDDVGTWTAFAQHLSQDDAGNTVVGKTHLYDSYRNIIYSSGRVITLCGVSDLIVVETEDAIMICPKGRVQDVKSLVAKLPEEIS